MNFGNEVMLRHAHARRFSPGELYTIDDLRYVITSVSIISNWHVILRLGDGETVIVLEIAPDGQIFCRDTKPVFQPEPESQQSLF